jgi:hypothetical protein
MDTNRKHPNNVQTTNADMPHPNDDQSTDPTDAWSRVDDVQVDDRTRVTVAQAAKLLGLSAEAVRSRLQRGTLKSEKVGGTVYVLLDTDQARPSDDQSLDHTAVQTTAPTPDDAHLVASLEEQVSFLRSELVTRNEELRRKDHIIAALTERIPELPAPGASTQESAEGTGREGPKSPTQTRSWLYRFFVGPE